MLPSHRGQVRDGGTAGLHHGDNLASMPDGHFVTLDAMVTHAGASWCTQAAAKHDGRATAADAHTKRSATASAEGGASEYEIVPLHAEVGGRLDAVAYDAPGGYCGTQINGEYAGFLKWWRQECWRVCIALSMHTRARPVGRLSTARRSH